MEKLRIHFSELKFGIFLLDLWPKLGDNGNEASKVIRYGCCWFCHIGNLSYGRDDSQFID